MLRDCGRLRESHARFYAANVLLALIFLHGRQIVYRDLKPENLMLDNLGYLKLIDFGLAKVLRADRTFTMCGTPEYLAPELISKRGHNRAVGLRAHRSSQPHGARRSQCTLSVHRAHL